MALHAKAKAEAGYRFYALYDKISREDILGACLCSVPFQQGLHRAWTARILRTSRRGVERCSHELALALRQETLPTGADRCVFIPKANGKLRPLGISTVRDRVCMMQRGDAGAGADLRSRPSTRNLRLPRGRNAQQAAVEVGGAAVSWSTGSRGRRLRGLLREHSASVELQRSVARRIVCSARAAPDQDVASTALAEETDQRGRKTRTTEARDQRRGIPQGSPLSPLAGESLHAPVCAGGGRSSALSEVSALASSSMPTTFP